MRFRNLAIPILFGAVAMTGASEASPLDQFHWQERVLVIVAPAGDPAAETQRRIYGASAKGMSERSIVLTEAVDDTERSRQIRSRLSAEGSRFQVFLVGKDGHTAASSTKPLSAEDVFARVDAMPMRQDEMRRGR
jgi:Domain of unknown function (DUF4174)